MGNNRGRIFYIPKDLCCEIDDIMKENRINERHKALKKLVDYSQVGREVERINKLNFKWRPRLR